MMDNIDLGLDYMKREHNSWTAKIFTTPIYYIEVYLYELFRAALNK